MFSGHPRTPQSPSQAHPAHDLPSKPSSSPKPNSLPTPAHSINGSMSLSATETHADLMQLDDTPKKRKRDIEDNGDQVQKKAHVEISRLSLDDLHLDVGKKYLLCRTRKTPFSTIDFPCSGLVFQSLFNSSPSQLFCKTWLTRM
jgi:hypothetical protein